jgi:N-ethylmaleimide reductase
MTTAFDPIELAGIRLSNRIAMAPMTRNRAYGPGATPTDSVVDYYAQRASAGLIITEGTQPNVNGQGYPNTPGLHSAEQVTAWRAVTDAVHANGGVIFAQLLHAGRIGHPSLLPDGMVPVGPSPVTPAGQIFTGTGTHEFTTPAELTDAEITATVADFATAAGNAVAAGFDGVEIHSANGYLPHQFLSTNANQRTDRWGGAVANRIRFTVEVVGAVTEAIGAHRVGLRLSPGNPYNDIAEDGVWDTYPALVDAINPVGIAYLHVMETGERELTRHLRKQFGGTFILNPATPGRFTSEDELGLVEDGTADMLSFGALFLANPDLPARLRRRGPYNTPDRATYYGGDERGYTDYARLDN